MKELLTQIRWNEDEQQWQAATFKDGVLFNVITRDVVDQVIDYILDPLASYLDGKGNLITTIKVTIHDPDAPVPTEPSPQPAKPTVKPMPRRA